MLILIIVALMLFGVKAAPRGSFFPDSFSVGQTKALKGIFALVVIFHHLYGADISPLLGTAFFEELGFLAVGGFFLISGYGLTYGVSNKKNYLRGFFFTRILSIVIPYYVIDSVYVVIRYLSEGNTDAFRTYLKESILGLEMWFVPVMVLLYVLFRLSFIGHEKRKNKLISPFILTFLTLAYVVLFTYTQHTAVNLLYGCAWNDTVLCFVLGMWYCILKERISPILQDLYYVVTPVTALTFAMSFVAVMLLPAYTWPTSPTRLVLRSVAAVAFGALVLLISMKVRFGNRVVNLCGDLSFELYLSHAIFIKMFRYGSVWIFSHYITLDIKNDLLYIAAVLVSSLAASWVVHKICGFILKPIQKAVKKQ